MTVDDIPNDVLGHCSLTSHPSESALVLQCLRALVLDDEQYCSQLHDDIQTLDWDWILSSCRKHRVGGFVAHLLARAGLLTRLAPSVQAGLNGEMARCSSNCRARQKEFEEISSILDSRDIPVVPLKGVALAQSIYGDARFRTMFDVDILVPDGRVQEAFDALVSTGFRRADSYVSRNRWHRSIYGTTCPEWDTVEIGRIPMRRDGVDLDLHYTPRYRVGGRYIGLDVAAMWQRARPVPRLGRNTYALAAPDLLSHLVLHAVELDNPSLVQALDIAMVSRRRQVNWRGTSFHVSLPEPSRAHVERFVRAINEWLDAERSTRALSPESDRVLVSLFSPTAGPKAQAPPAGVQPAIEGLRMLRRVRSPMQRLRFVLGYFLPSREYYRDLSRLGAWCVHWRSLSTKAVRLMKMFIL